MLGLKKRKNNEKVQKEHLWGYLWPISGSNDGCRYLIRCRKQSYEIIKSKYCTKSYKRATYRPLIPLTTIVSGQVSVNGRGF